VAAGARSTKAASLAIMATKVVEVRECDRCGKEPAHTWMITGPEGATREIELCDRHAAAIANAFALGRAVAPRPGRGRPARTSRTTATAGAAKPRAAVAPQEPEPIWR
jgi:hypothetical protein